jgi:hypothetical protein
MASGLAKLHGSLVRSKNENLKKIPPLLLRDFF